MSATVYSVANQKGGVGKTATAVNLAAALARMGQRVLLVDLDAQANATSTLGGAKLQPTIAEVLLYGARLKSACWPTGRERLVLAPASMRLAGYRATDRSRLAAALDEVRAEYGAVVLDCPPSLDGSTLLALAACEEVIVPVQCEYLALEGLARLLGTVERVRGARAAGPGLRYLLTMFDSRNNLAHQVSREVRAHFGERVAKAVIPRSVRVAEAPGFGRTIFEHDPNGPAAEAHREFAREVLRRAA